MLWNSPQCVAQFLQQRITWTSVSHVTGARDPGLSLFGRVLPTRLAVWGGYPSSSHWVLKNCVCIFCQRNGILFHILLWFVTRIFFLMFSTPEYVYIYETIKHFTHFFFKSEVLCHLVIWAYLFRKKCWFNYPWRKTSFPLVPGYAPYFWPSIANGARGRIQRGDKLSPSESRSSSVPVDNVGPLRASVPRVFPCPGANRLDQPLTLETPAGSRPLLSSETGARLYKAKAEARNQWPNLSQYGQVLFAICSFYLLLTLSQTSVGHARVSTLVVLSEGAGEQ